MKNKTTHFSLAALAVSASLIGLSFAGHEKGGTPEFWSYPSAAVSSGADVIAAKTPGDIDLAICLDTSGSMDGLIESAKQRLWALVNDLAKAEPAPSCASLCSPTAVPTMARTTAGSRRSCP